MGKNLNRCFTKKRYTKHMERFSTSLVIRKNKTKITTKYHYTPTRIAKIKKTGNKQILVEIRNNQISQMLLVPE